MSIFQILLICTYLLGVLFSTYTFFLFLSQLNRLLYRKPNIWIQAILPAIALGIWSWISGGLLIYMVSTQVNNFGPDEDEKG